VPNLTQRHLDRLLETARADGRREALRQVHACLADHWAGRPNDGVAFSLVAADIVRLLGDTDPSLSQEAT